MGGSSPEEAVETAPVFTSLFPELKDKEYGTQDELTDAEAGVTRDREAKAATEAKLAEQERVRQEKAKVLQEGKTELVKTALTDPTS